MQMEKVRDRAKKLGVKSARMKKEDLIRAIQKAEGNFPCFGTAGDFCDQFSCCWLDGCLEGENVTSPPSQGRSAGAKATKEV